MLETDGFLLLRNVLTTQEIQEGITCITDDGKYVDYARLVSFIRQRMFGALRGNLQDWQDKPLDFVKFRVSDNNNSADASGFHRDLIYQGSSNTGNFTPPFFTCLTYFDQTTLEIIPKSHNVPSYKLVELPRLYSSKIAISINPGDLLVFYSSLLHRGIFTEKLPHRRLIQVFEVFNDHNVLSTIVPRILHVPGDETYSNMIIKASRNKGLLIDTYNICMYINAATGYGVKYNTLKHCGLSEYTFFSSEGLRGRISIVPGTWQEINKYILNTDLPLYDIPSQCYKLYNYNVFKRTCINIMIGFIALLVILLVVLIIILNTTFRKRNYKPQSQRFRLRKR